METEAAENPGKIITWQDNLARGWIIRAIIIWRDGISDDLNTYYRTHLYQLKLLMDTK